MLMRTGGEARASRRACPETRHGVQGRRGKVVTVSVNAAVEADIDVEKIAFEQIEQRTPSIAELLLSMAAQKAPLYELEARLWALAERDQLGGKDYLTALVALRYARRYVTTEPGH